MPWPLPRAIHWCHEFLWPGDLAEEAAKSALAEYHKEFDVVRLHEAVDYYRQAVDQRRRRNHRLLASTLAGYADAVWTQYMRRKDEPDDLENAVALGREALDIWPTEKSTQQYVDILYLVASAYFETYERSTRLRTVRIVGNIDAYDLAFHYFTELKDRAVGGNLTRTVQIRLGALIAMRCDFGETTDRLESGLQYLTDVLAGLSESEMADKGGKRREIEDVQAMCFYNLATLYECRSEWLKGHGDHSKLQDISMAIDHSVKARILLERLHRSELPLCTFRLARQLWRRWRKTGNQTDFADAKVMARAAMTGASEDFDGLLCNMVDVLLQVLSPTSRPGSLASSYDSEFLESDGTSSVSLLPLLLE